MEFAYDGGGLAKGGDVTLYYDGTAVGTGRVEATQPMIFSADETTDIGYESGTTVTPDYTADDQPLHRQDPLGADRPRRRRPRPLHRPRRAPPHRHGPAVGSAPHGPRLGDPHRRRLRSPWGSRRCCSCGAARPRAATSTTATAPPASSACWRPGFSVLLGFIVFLAFTSYDQSRSGAETEALVVAQQVETAQFFPAPAAAS